MSISFWPSNRSNKWQWYADVDDSGLQADSRIESSLAFSESRQSLRRVLRLSDEPDKLAQRIQRKHCYVVFVSRV